MNKFNIGEKYNEIGTDDPKAFVKWLLENLSENYRVMLRQSLKHILEMIAHYDHAQWAAERKIHMPWDKESSMVDADHYMKRKQDYCKSKLSEVFRALGMEDLAYRDPEVIARAHVLEIYIDQIYDEVVERMKIEKDSEDYQKVLKEKAKILDSIDLGKDGYGFKVNLNNEDVEIVIMPRSEMEVLAKLCEIRKPYPFLLQEEDITLNGTGYCIIDASSKEYRECMVYKMLLDKKGVQKENPDKTEAKSAARIMNMEQLFPASGQER